MGKKIKIDKTRKIHLVCAGILLMCILPLPYGFYTIVRIVTTVLSAYLAYGYYVKGRKELALMFAIIALITLFFIPFTINIITLDIFFNKYKEFHIKRALLPFT